MPSTTGQTTFFFVADIPVSTGTYIDTLGDDTVALNTILPSTLWTPPPEGLQGIMSMPNGMASKVTSCGSASRIVPTHGRRRTF